MKGLLLKDLLNLRRQMKIVLLLIAVYVFLSIVQHSTALLGGVIGVLAGMLPITALAYDERAKWDSYALTMPVSRGDLVISKYLLGLMLSCLAFVINLALSVVMTEGSMRENLLTSLALLGVGILFMSLVLPIMFKFGVEKGRIGMFIFLFIPTALISLLPKLGLPMPGPEVWNALAYAAPLAIIAIVAGSMAISLKIYANKEM